MSDLEIKGQFIDDVPYSGLVERLLQISLVCVVGSESQEHLSKSDLIELLDQISGLTQDALQFSCADIEDIERMNKSILAGMVATREPLN